MLTFWQRRSIVRQVRASVARRESFPPFDNLVIQRERLRWLFEFDYQLECYLPAAKRRYGYFVLPVLWGDRSSRDSRRKPIANDQSYCSKESGSSLVISRIALQSPAHCPHGFALFNRCDQVDDASSRAD